MLKYQLFLSCLALLLCACGAQPKPAPESQPTLVLEEQSPAWYSSRALDAVTADYLALGYGSGASLEAARNIAIREIAQRIQTRVESNSSDNRRESYDGERLSYWSRSDLDFDTDPTFSRFGLRLNR